jgi:hypothetical protein
MAIWVWPQAASRKMAENVKRKRFISKREIGEVIKN